MELCLPNISEGAGILLAGIAAAALGVIGWLAKSIFDGMTWYYMRRTVEIERMVALLAEIRSNLAFQASYASVDFRLKMEKRYAEDRNYKMFIPIYKENVVFDRIKQDITTLPSGPIESVVDYYLKSNGFDVLLATFEGDKYQAFDTTRKLEILDRTVAFAEHLCTTGERSIAALEHEISTSLFRRAAVTGVVLICAALAAAKLTTVHFQAFAVIKCEKPAERRAFLSDVWRNDRISHTESFSINRAFGAPNFSKVVYGDV